MMIITTQWLLLSLFLIMGIYLNRTPKWNWLRNQKSPNSFFFFSRTHLRLARERDGPLKRER